MKVSAEDAVRALLAHAGDDPDREGLLETPKRVAKAFGEWFSGYETDPKEYLNKTFDEVGGYDEIVILKDIRLESYCEHHMAPIIGNAHVGYLPDRKIVGLSKLARVVEGYAKRLQVQERLTAQIADAIEQVLEPRGVFVIINAAHFCTATRGIHKHGSEMITSAMRGVFREDSGIRAEVMALISDRK